LIDGYVSALKEMKGINENEQHKIEKLESLVKEVASYTDKLLLFSQSKRVQTKEFDLIFLMNKIMSEYTDRLKFGSSVSSAFVNGNFELVRVMFYDMLEYLCGFVGESGSLMVDVSILETEGNNDLYVEDYNKILLICIKEEGSVIPKDTLSNIFEPFAFVVKNNKCNTGLSFVYGVVKSLGGIVEVTPEDENGFTINIKIPVKQQ